MKKILIFCMTYYPDIIGGVEVAVKEITDRIDSSDIEFHMVTRRYAQTLPKVERIGNITVHRVGWGMKEVNVGRSYSPLFYFSKIFFVPSAALKGIILNRQHHFDGAWAMMTYMLFPLVLMRMVGISVPYAATLQEGDPFEHVFSRWYIRPFKPLLYMGFSGATIVQAISSFLGVWGKSMGARRVVVIPNAVDTNRFATIDQAAITEARKVLGKKEGEVFLITTSRHVEKNASDVTIRALALLPTHIHFAILGTGPLEGEYRQLAEDLGVASRVHFLGQIENDALPGYLHAADVFVRPSRSEGLGSSFIETMAAGIPVIATQVGGIVDFLFDEKRNPENVPTGFAVDVNSPEQIAKAVTDILADPEKVKRIVENARALAVKEYDWNLIARRMREEVFASILK